MVFLLILGTSVPVERIFSGGVDLITKRRCSLQFKYVCAWKIGSKNFNKVIKLKKLNYSIKNLFIQLIFYYYNSCYTNR